MNWRGLFCGVVTGIGFGVMPFHMMPGITLIALALLLCILGAQYTRP